MEVALSCSICHKRLRLRRGELALFAGYRYSFPFLEGAGIVSVQDNRVDPLYRHVFPPAHAPWLSFVGIPFKVRTYTFSYSLFSFTSALPSRPSTGCQACHLQVIPFPQFELQGKWIARALSGRAHLPSVQVNCAAL